MWLHFFPWLFTCVHTVHPVVEHCLRFNPVMTKWYETHPGMCHLPRNA